MFNYAMVSGRNIGARAPPFLNVEINSLISMKLDSSLKLPARSFISVRGLLSDLL